VQSDKEVIEFAYGKLEAVCVWKNWSNPLLMICCRRSNRFLTTTCHVFWRCRRTWGRVSARCWSTSVSDVDQLLSFVAL